MESDKTANDEQDDCDEDDDVDQKMASKMKQNSLGAIKRASKKDEVDFGDFVCGVTPSVSPSVSPSMTAYSLMLLYLFIGLLGLSMTAVGSYIAYRVIRPSSGAHVATVSAFHNPVGTLKMLQMHTGATVNVCPHEGWFESIDYRRTPRRKELTPQTPSRPEWAQYVFAPRTSTAEWYLSCSRMSGIYRNSRIHTYRYLVWRTWEQPWKSRLEPSLWQDIGFTLNAAVALSPGRRRTPSQLFDHEFPETAPTGSSLAPCFRS